MGGEHKSECVANHVDVIEMKSSNPARQTVNTHSAVRKILVFCLVCMFSVCSTGCIVIPVPHVRTHQPTCSGILIDAETKKPISGAIIRSTAFPDISSTSDSHGHFFIPAKRKFHGAYLIGAINMSLFPPWDVASPVFEIEIQMNSRERILSRVDSRRINVVEIAPLF